MSEKKPSIEEFNALLRQTVEAKRLSGGKVQELVQTGVKFLKDDIALLHSLHKTHKSLPPRSQGKISSLYVLDSLSRGVHKLYRNALKNKDDDNKTAVYAKGFLGKVEGVLEGWARDMCDWPEGREKMIKILDIWTKSQTFSPGALARVQAVVDSTSSTSVIANDAATGSGTPNRAGERSTTPIKSPQVASTSAIAGSSTPLGTTNGGVMAGAGVGVGASAGTGPGAGTITEAPAIMPDFLSFLSTQIQTAKPASPAGTNAVGSPSAGAGPVVPNLAFLNGILPPANAGVIPDQNPYATTHPMQNISHAPSIPTPPHIPGAGSTPNPISPFPIAAPPAPFVPPQANNLSAAMAKRDEIAKKFAMMGQGSTAMPSIPPPSSMSGGPPPGQYMNNSIPQPGPSGGQSHTGPLRGGQPFPDRGGRDPRGERFPVRNGGDWNTPPQFQGGRFENNASAGSPGWRAQPPRGRSRSPPRAEPARSGRAPLPGAGQPGKDEFGRDLTSRRSASPQRDRGEVKRPRLSSDQEDTVKPVESANQPKSIVKLEDLDISTLNPAEAKTWEVLGEAWINTHGRPPEGPDVMMWFMNATAEKMNSAAGTNGHAGGMGMTMAPGMNNANSMISMSMPMMPLDNSHQQARLDWNDDGPYSGGAGGGGGQRGGGGGGGGRGNW